MNIFFTDRDPIKCARSHCLVLVNKMIVEHTQMLSTGKRVLENDVRKVWVRKINQTKQDDGTMLCQVKDRLVNWLHVDGDEYEIILGKTYLKSNFYYKSTHENHPSCKWVRESFDNYFWLIDCTLELCKMYTESTGKVHASEAVIRKIEKNIPANIPLFDFNEPPAVVDEKFKYLARDKGTIQAYKSYLLDKFDDWSGREKPIKVEFLQVPIWAI